MLTPLHASAPLLRCFSSLLALGTKQVLFIVHIEPYTVDCGSYVREQLLLPNRSWEVFIHFFLVYATSYIYPENSVHKSVDFMSIEDCGVCVAHWHVDTHKSVYPDDV
jgi:hypothetical protein